jgi:hypothetical protein
MAARSVITIRKDKYAAPQINALKKTNPESVNYALIHFLTSGLSWPLIDKDAFSFHRKSYAHYVQLVLIS